MKKLCMSALVMGSLWLASDARAQVYGQLTGAETAPVGGHVFGAYVEASQNVLGLFSQLRLSFYPNVDFGFHGGLNRISVGTKDRTTLRIGGDVKFLVSKGPVDVSAGGALGVETGDGISILTIGPTVVASRSFPMGTGGGITPYGGVALLFSNVDIADARQTDVSMPFRFGSEFKISPEIKLVAEIQLRASDEINDDFAFVTGVNLPF